MALIRCAVVSTCIIAFAVAHALPSIAQSSLAVGRNSGQGFLADSVASSPTVYGFLPPLQHFPLPAVSFLEINGAQVPQRRQTLNQSSIRAQPTPDLTHQTRQMVTNREAAVLTAETAAPATSAVAARAAKAPMTASPTGAAMSGRSWFAASLSVAFVVKALCMLSNIVFQVAPFPQVRNFAEKGCTGEIDAAPFMSILYGGCQWCFYGFFAFEVTQKSGFLVLVYSNVMGALLGVYYVWGFQKNCKNSSARIMLYRYYRIAGSLAFLQLLGMLFLRREQALFLSGLVSSVCSIVGAFSLLTTLPTVLKTKNSASINVPLLIVGICSTALWLLCGLLLSDPWLILPNFVGVLVQLAAYSVVCWYPPHAEHHTSDYPRSTLGSDSNQGNSALASERSASTETPLALSEVPGLECYSGNTEILGETGGTF